MTSNRVISEARYIKCVTVLVASGKEHVASQMQTRVPLLALRFCITRVLYFGTVRFICLTTQKDEFSDIQKCSNNFRADSNYIRAQALKAGSYC